MIYTVTFSPAIDYVVRLDELLIDEINRCKSENMYVGGKGINVSVILARLGVQSVATGFIAGFTGRAIRDEVLKCGIEADFIELCEGCSRINVKINSGEETQINGKGPAISSEEADKLIRRLCSLQDGDMLVLAGSIPSTLPDDIYERILERLSDRNVRFVVDAENMLLKNTLKYRPFLIKPNDIELGAMFGKTIRTDDEIVKAAKQLQALGARNVLVSRAEKGAIFIGDDNKVIKIGAPCGEVVNSVGAGDSMLAGFIAGYEKSGSYDYALKLGTAAGSATAFSSDLATKELIEKIFATL